MKKLSFLFLLILFVSCQKEGDNLFPDTKIEGVVLDKDTGEPIEGANVSAYRKGSTSIILSVADSKLKSCKTNKKGEYTLKIDALADKSYFVKIHDDFFCQDTVLPVTKFEKNQQTIQASRKGQLKVILKNSLGDTPEHLSAKLPHPQDYITCDYIGGGIYHFVGDKEESFQEGINANLMVAIEVEVKRNGQSTLIKDSVFCKSNVLTEKIITY